MPRKVLSMLARFVSIKCILEGECGTPPLSIKGN